MLKLTSFVLLLLIIPVTSHPYAKEFRDDCRFTIQFYQNHEDVFKRAADKVETTPEILFSIVAPEISQYSYLRNKVETQSLLVLYVQGGSAYANFSIGYFQMKPSFAESIETQIASQPHLKDSFSNLTIHANNVEEKRAIRVNRLSSFKWQVEYLAAFYELAIEKYNLQHRSLSHEEIMTLAACYNVGLNRSIQEINTIGNQSQFPRFSFRKYKYKEVSLFFYQEIAR